MPPPSPWERVPSFPAGEQTPAWATLILAGAARGWMIFAIVWGSIVFLGQNITQNVFSSHNQSNAQQLNTVSSDTNAANAAINGAGKSINGCTTVSCLRPAYIVAATKLTHLADDVRGMSLPSDVSGRAQDVESDATQLASIFTELANSSDVATYRATAQSSNFESILTSYASDTRSFWTTLRADQG